MPDGFLNVELTGAGVVDTINRAGEKGIVLYDVYWCGDISVRFRIAYADYFLLNKLAAKQGDELKVLSRRGGRFWLYSLLGRPVLMVFVVGLILLSAWLPGRVLFVSVEGNEQVDTQLILQTAEECGVYFGAKRAVVRSEAVKNRMLEKLPQLKWAGVNTQGCVAVISVQEDLPEEKRNEQFTASSVVASRDGVVLSVTATSGYVRCKVGDAVKAGQVLISGRMEEGILCKLMRSQGEILAQTHRSCTAVTPTVYMKKASAVRKDRKISLLICKKRINLSKDSGIYPASYDRIYLEYYVTLPGGSVLPIALAVDEFIEHKQEAFYVSDPETLVLQTAEEYILEQMISGSIISSSVRQAQCEDVCKMFGDYLCTEMIGFEQDEEMDITNGEDH